MTWLLNRLTETSTWNGIIVALTGLGATLSPDLSEAIIGAGASLFVLINVIRKEKTSNDA